MIDYPLALHMQDTQDFDLVDEVAHQVFCRWGPADRPGVRKNFAEGFSSQGSCNCLELMAQDQARLGVVRAGWYGDTFENVVDSMNGYKSSTIDKYIRMWESIFENDTIFRRY